MIQEVTLRFYNSELKIGFNNWREIYCNNSNVWIKCDYHLGRLVYGKKRIPYKKIVKKITHRNYIVQEFIPF